MKRLIKSPFEREPGEESLADERRDSIKRASGKAKKQMVELQRQFIEKQQKKEKKLSAPEKRRQLRLPAWTTLTATTSQKGRRLVVGLRNQGCNYRRNNIPGCLACGFYARTVDSLTPSTQDLDFQLKKAIADAVDSAEEFDTLEFLGDGSFLCDREIDDDTKRVLFNRIDRHANITRILVESRPNEIDPDDVRILTQHLSRKQFIEVGIGFETASDFVRTYCLNKGFSLADFERSIELIAKNKKNLSRFRVVAYLLFKPPFLTEQESIADMIRSLHYLKDLSKRTGIKIIPKIEPAVVASGTVLDILNQSGSYEPPSFWSVVEVLMHAHQLGLAKDTRIGGRYDMFDAERIPAVYSQDHEGMLHRHDFIIYGAVMAFNVHHDIRTLLTDLQESLAQDCFMRWQAGMVGEPNGESLTSLYSRKYKNAIKAKQRTPGYREHLQRQERISGALDDIEYNSKEVKQILAPARGTTGNCQERLNIHDLKDLFVEIFDSRGVNGDITIIECYMQRSGLCRIYFKLKDLEKPGLVSEIWTTVPLSQNAETK